MIRPSMSLVAIATLCSFTASVNAAWVVGTVGFNVQGSVASSGNNLSSAISLTNVRTNNSATGDWDIFTSSHHAGGMLATDILKVGDHDSTGSALSFSNENFGSFTGRVIFDDLQDFNVGFLQSSTRLLNAVGLFKPGLTLVQQGYDQVVIAEVSIFIQGFTGLRSLPTSARSGTVVMATQPVPEPATGPILIVAAASYFGLRLRTRRRAKSS